MVAARPVDPTIYLDFSLCKRPSSRAEGALHRAGSLTIYTLKSKYGGTDVSDAPRLLPGQLDQCFLQASGGRSQLGQGSSESGVPKKRLELAGMRKDVAFASQRFQVSERRACKLLGIDRGSYRYEPRTVLSSIKRFRPLEYVDHSLV